jgi:hypothetical protein
MSSSRSSPGRNNALLGMEIRVPAIDRRTDASNVECRAGHSPCEEGVHLILGEAGSAALEAIECIWISADCLYGSLSDGTGIVDVDSIERGGIFEVNEVIRAGEAAAILCNGCRNERVPEERV